MPKILPSRISLSDQVHAKIKADIFDFRLLPGDRFTENETAERLGVSRTPVREALYRLQREGYLQVYFRNGWQVLPLDFERFDQLYDLRIILELSAVEKLCKAENDLELDVLRENWLLPELARLVDGTQVSELDESFHQGLVAATGNREMTKVHQGLTEQIRIIRRLDFTKPHRIAATYDEHAQILRLLTQRKSAQAMILLKSHIEESKAEVRKITMHMLFIARRPL